MFDWGKPGLLKVLFSAILVASLFGFVYLGKQVYENSDQLNFSIPAQTAAVSNSVFDNVFCFFSGVFGFPCEDDTAYTPTTIVPLVEDNLPPETPALVPTYRSEDNDTSNETVVQNVTNEYVTNPVERETIREVVIRNEQVSSTNFITRTEYENQVDAIMRSIENSGDGGITNINSESIEDLSDVASMTETLGDLLTWNGTTWSNTATSSLGISSGLFTDGGDTTYLTATSDFLSIGTTTGASKLHVVGTAGTSDIFTLASSTGSSLLTFTSSGRLGLGTASPTQLLHVAGNMRLTGGLFDSNNATGTLGMILQTTGTSTRWVATSTLGILGSLFTDGGDTTYLTATSDFLSIGTSTALSKLSVYGDLFLEGSSRYLNFGTATGTSGYGIRDSSGVLEFKNSSSSNWSTFSGRAGINWATSTVAGDDALWESIVYGNGRFVAVGNTSDFFGGGPYYALMTSSDGINWATSTAAGDNDQWNYVTYGNGLFVAVGNTIDTFGTPTYDAVMTSPDGITWTVRSAAGDNDTWNSVTYANGLFVAVGSYGADRVMTSPDGITWTVRSAAGDNDTWNSVTYANGLFVAVGSSGDRVMTSPDGITWTVRSAAGDNDTWNSVTYANGLFVAVGSSGDRVMTSPDGITWTVRSAAGDNDTWNSVTYANGLFVAVGSSGDRVMTSPDGITWTARSAAGDNDSWTSVTYGNGIFVAVGNAVNLFGGGSFDAVMTSGSTEYTALAHNNLYQGGLNVMGNVGIGTTTGASKLHVIGTAGNTSALTVASSTGSSMFSIAATGNATFVGSGGTCTINGSGACSSDERLKTGFKDLNSATSSALTNLMTLRTGTYNWADTTWDQSENIGVLAQDLLAVYPQLVGEAPTTFMGVTGTYYTVNYAGLTVPIIAAIKELNLKFEDLATTTTFADLEDRSFTKQFFNKLIAWFADATNGIGTMVASVFRASDMICVDDECLTADDIRQLKDGNNLNSPVVDVVEAGDGNHVNYDDGGSSDSEGDDDTTLSPALVPGCADVNALNYNIDATEDDGSCEYEADGQPATPVPGCTDTDALNYDSSATEDDDTCEYEEEPTGEPTDPVEPVEPLAQDEEEEEVVEDTPVEEPATI